MTVRDIQGNHLSILGKTLTHVSLTGSKKIMSLEAIVTSGLSNDDFVIGLESMLQFQLLPPNWPSQEGDRAEKPPADQSPREPTTAQPWIYPRGALILTVSQLLTLSSAVYAMTDATEFKIFFDRMSTIDIFAMISSQAICLTILGNISIFPSVLIWEKIQSSYTAQVKTPRLDTSAASQVTEKESLKEGLTMTKSPDNSIISLLKSVRAPVSFFTLGTFYLILDSLSLTNKALPDLEMGGTTSAPPPATPPLESNGLELSLVNFHPESFNKGLNWTSLCIGLAVLAIFVFKLWPIIQHWIDECRHRTQMRMHRREIMLDLPQILYPCHQYADIQRHATPALQPSSLASQSTYHSQTLKVSSKSSEERKEHNLPLS